MVGSDRDAPLALATLRACRLFGGMDDASLELVSDALRPRHFRRAETLFHIGDLGDALFIVASGHVKIILPPDDGSEPAILTTIGPGGFFGELALLDGAHRSATAVALDATTTLILRRDAFDRLVDDQPALRRALLAALAAEIRRLTAQVHDLYFLDLPSRLAQHLLRSLPHEPGTAEDPGAVLPDGEVRLPWPYTQAELASMIGGSRQSVNRLLSEYVGAGLVRFEGDELVIPDVRRLSAAIRR
jgi:CRP-like cAMP-binding protein